jgi:hypothetical protein
MFKKILFLVILLLVLVSYFLGYWPQHQQVETLQQENTKLRQQLSRAEAVGRLAGLQNELLDLLGEIEKQNYGEAQRLSSKFFDDVRKEADRDKTAPYLAALETILARRDAVTMGLTKGEAATATPLRQTLTELKQIISGMEGTPVSRVEPQGKLPVASKSGVSNPLPAMAIHGVFPGTPGRS